MSQTTIELTDIYRSAYHLTMGGDLIGIKINNNGRQIVTFKISGTCLERNDREYRSGRALVNPLQLRESLNHLRDLLFKKLNENKGRMNNDRERKNISHQKLY